MPATATDLIPRIERLLDARVENLEPVHGGYTPALRLRCRSRGAASATVFVKAGATPLTDQFLHREIWMYTHLSGPFMPRLLAWEDSEQAPILIIEDLSAWHWPPPWNEHRLDLVLEQIEALHHAPVNPALGPGAGESNTRNWHTVASDPAPFLSLGIASAAWLERALPSLVPAASQARAEGSSLTHWDLRSDNICISASVALFVDWNLAGLGNPVLDLGFFLPSLAAEGGPLPESILPSAPEIAAHVSGFFAARAGLPPIPDAPRVRWVQRQQLDTALPWAIRALDLPPLDGVRGH